MFIHLRSSMTMCNVFSIWIGVRRRPPPRLSSPPAHRRPPISHPETETQCIPHPSFASCGRVRSHGKIARDNHRIIISDISSFPAGVHAPGFRLSAKVTKVEGCAWLDAHQSPDRSHSQRISNRCEGFFHLFSLISQGDARHGSEGGRRGGFCGIEKLRAVSGTSL